MTKEKELYGPAIKPYTERECHEVLFKMMRATIDGCDFIEVESEGQMNYLASLKERGSDENQNTRRL